MYELENKKCSKPPHSIYPITEHVILNMLNLPLTPLYHNYISIYPHKMAMKVHVSCLNLEKKTYHPSFRPRNRLSFKHFSTGPMELRKQSMHSSSKRARDKEQPGLFGGNQDPEIQAWEDLFIGLVCLDVCLGNLTRKPIGFCHEKAMGVSG